MWFISGFSAKTTDKRVDKIALKHDYKDYLIFYSPIKIWLFFNSHIIVSILLFTPLYRNSTFITIVVLWIIWAYLFAAKNHNSFILSNNELVVVNPNFPFKKITQYNLNDIDKIVIDDNKFRIGASLLTSIENNNLKIYSKNQTIIFYCNSLQVDCYDENLTELNLDDLNSELIKRGINTENLI